VIEADVLVEPLVVEPAGRADAPLRPRDEVGIEGAELVPLRPHIDQRGSLTEIINIADPFWRESIVHAYVITIAPGRIKGWGVHRRQADRYVVINGLVRVALHDGRPDSSSFGVTRTLFLGERAPALLRIPPGVWHADQNLGAEELTILNFPTVRFDPADPDKQRIDPHAGVIPYDWTVRDG
jgi:dTDP-4-dehydrorhamnose 3,5-epimerase